MMKLSVVVLCLMMFQQSQSLSIPVEQIFEPCGPHGEEVSAMEENSTNPFNPHRLFKQVAKCYYKPTASVKLKVCTVHREIISNRH